MAPAAPVIRTIFSLRSAKRCAPVVAFPVDCLAFIVGCPPTPLQPVCLVTGASAGIGKALARVFAQNGHVVALTARRETELQALADEIAAAGHPRPHVSPSISAPRRHGASGRSAASSPARTLHRRQQCRLRPARRRHGPRSNAPACHDRSQCPGAHRSVAALALPGRAASRRHPQRRLGREFLPRPRHGGLSRHQGLCVVLHRVAARGTQGRGRPRLRALPRAGRDRIFSRLPACRKITLPPCSAARPSGWRATATRASWAATAWWCPARRTVF